MATPPLKRIRKPKKKKSSALLLIVVAVTTAVLVCGGVVTLMLAPHIAKRRLDLQQDAETMRSLADSPDRPVWTADAKLIERLGPEAAFLQYRIRLPPGFILARTTQGAQPERIPGGGTEHNSTWRGPRLPSGFHALIALDVRWPPSGKDARAFFEGEFPAELRAMKNSHKVSEVAAGRVAGKQAIRVCYSMPEGPTECVELFRFELNCLLVVTAVCPSADRSEVLPLLQAAQLTLRDATQFAAAPAPRHAEPAMNAPAANQTSVSASRRSTTEVVVDAPAPSGGDSRLFGNRFGNEPSFHDESPQGGMLIGLELGTKPGFGTHVITTVRPLYRTVEGREIAGQEHGSIRENQFVARAKDGYAVGGVIIKTGLVVDGLSIVFMRVRGDGLDPADAYESDWFGGSGGGPPTRVGCDGTPVIGIIGALSDEQCIALGLRFRTREKK